MLDLNAARAAKAATEDQFKVVALGNDPAGAALQWRFLSDPPIDAVTRLRAGDIAGAVARLIHPEDFEGFMEQVPTVGNLHAIIEYLTGTTAGN
jgi:hypothetical protein